MKRKIYQKLLDWKDRGMKKPLMIIGARQVGKTYIIEEFCKNEFNNFLSINLLEHPEIKELYSQNISTNEKFIRLCAFLDVNPNLEDTVIFFDEISSSLSCISSKNIIVLPFIKSWEVAMVNLSRKALQSLFSIDSNTFIISGCLIKLNSTKSHFSSLRVFSIKYVLPICLAPVIKRAFFSL